MGNQTIRELAAKAYASKSGALAGSPNGLDSMKDEDFDQLDPNTKKQLMQHYHLGMAKSSDPGLRAQVQKVFEAGMDLRDFVMLTARMDEPFFDDPDFAPLRRIMAEQQLEVWSVVTHREAFTNRLEHFGKSDAKYKEYLQAYAAVVAEPKPHYMHIVMMAGGMVSWGQVRVTQDDAPAEVPALPEAAPETPAVAPTEEPG